MLAKNQPPLVNEITALRAELDAARTALLLDLEDRLRSRRKDRANIADQLSAACREANEREAPLPTAEMKSLVSALAIADKGILAAKEDLEKERATIAPKVARIIRSHYDAIAPDVRAALAVINGARAMQATVTEFARKHGMTDLLPALRVDQ